jgi:hypothetical protein
MNAHTAAIGTRGALRFQRTLGADLFRVVDCSTRLKRHLLPSRASNEATFPIQGKRLLVKVFSLAHRLGFAIYFQLITALLHQMATQLGAIDMEFL